MSKTAIPLPEFDTEMASTRKLLTRVPAEQGTWKPHPKSFALGHLAQLVARMPGWIALTLRETELDIARGAPYSFETTDVLLREFDRNAAAAREALADVTDDALDVPWTLRLGERVIFTTPRGEVVRNHLNHLIHHRGQLTVYVRLVDAPVPAIYGPSADERM